MVVQVVVFTEADLAIEVSDTLGDEMIVRGVLPEQGMVMSISVEPERLVVDSEGRLDKRIERGISGYTMAIGFGGNLGGGHSVDILSERIAEFLDCTLCVPVATRSRIVG